ncbi:MAG TPA: hypothetical protein VMR25_03065 [Planctomycetaceae bacterium]|jgi:hypothetical protein|nr:hypothetical protein [Planctomycetaceae bacterium]
MWTARNEKCVGGLRFAVERNSQPTTFDDVVGAWQADESFREWFNSLLADVPFTAFRWETPSVTTATIKRPFEFVIMDAPGLARRSNPEAFAKHFAGAKAAVMAFANLGGDAIMVVPCPIADPSAYGHLAAFVRLAPRSQRHSLWQLVGETMARRLGPKPVWLSTAGAGVSWLHVRLDDRPKYYGFGPYRANS